MNLRGHNNRTRSRAALKLLFNAVRREWPDVRGRYHDDKEHPVQLLFGGNRGFEVFSASYFTGSKRYVVTQRDFYWMEPSLNFDRWEEPCVVRSLAEFPRMWEAWIAPCLNRTYCAACDCKCMSLRREDARDLYWSAVKALEQFGLTPDLIREMFTAQFRKRVQRRRSG